MKKIILILLLITPVIAQERIDLTVPETKPSNLTYIIERIVLDYKNGILSVSLIGQNNESVSCSYNSFTTPTGTFLLTALNKANLSSTYAGNTTTGTLNQRIFHHLVIMGESANVCNKTIVGTIGGTVQ